MTKTDEEAFEPCRRCGLPVRPGEPRYTLREPEEFEHYDCHDASLRDLRDSGERLKNTAEELSKTLEILRGRVDRGW